MKTAHEDTIHIETIEELTLYSLDRSIEGLEKLRRESIYCGEGFLAHSADVLSRFSEFVKRMHDFYVFENDVRSLFEINGELIRDNKGHLKTIEAGLDDVMKRITVTLDGNDMIGLSDLLRIDIPILLERFQDLLPALRNYIENEYVLAVN
jgi:hypothetical protein